MMTFKQIKLSKNVPSPKPIRSEYISNLRSKLNIPSQNRSINKLNGNKKWL